MDSSEFQEYFDKIPILKAHFLGVYPIDKIPKLLKNKTFFVANTDPSFKQGTHWIAFIKLKSKEIEIFDSLGFQPDKFKQYLKFEQEINLIYNTTPVQNKVSILCGKFVVTFLIERMFNQSIPFNDLIDDIFFEDLNANDLFVNIFCNNL